MCLPPKLARNHKCIEIERLPPGDFVARLMKLSMMPTAEWNGEFIADFDAQSAQLRETQMVWVAGVPSANKTWL